MKLSGLVGSLHEGYNHHDPAAIGRLYHPDAIHEDIARGQPKRGQDAIVAGLRKFFGWFPDAHWEARSCAGGFDGSVAVSYLLRATLQSRMGPIIACGQQISLRGVHVLELHDGLIRRSEDYWDASTFHRQLNPLPQEIRI